ncbi:IclR family transcriptional regulator [Paenibacillus nasutitermitis]|uniref:IclR family transcriptional regulator n=1 Tax=Paenibacillus nasutitermitis TaxID=1652958 RepID=A0A916ZF78_9BACL|nr:IclR family transcriptional regulator [Paenibacillus nasutitermitis]GGD93733.1 IclR family transcriptional regulator [Paenibacillus nasutitermitis]
MKKQYSVPALEKGMAIIEMLASSKDPLGVTDIYEQNGLPKSSIFTILSALEDLGYVMKTEEGKYQLTLKLYNVGLERLSKLDIRQAAQPEMEWIAANMKFTVHLAILENDRALYIDKVNGPGFVQFSTHIGQTQMLHNSGVGKALAAYLTDEQLTHAIERHGMPKTTDHTMTSLEDFKLFLASVRETGYAIEDEEGEVGIRCIAVPIFNHKGKTIGALGITALRNELPSISFHDFGNLLKDKALTVSRKLGFNS